MIGIRETRTLRKSTVQSMRIVTRNSKNCPSHAEKRENGLVSQSKKKDVGNLAVAGNSQSEKAWLSVEKQLHVAEWVSKHSQMCSYSEQCRWEEFSSDSAQDNSSPLKQKNKFNERRTRSKAESTSNMKSPVWNKSVLKNQSNIETSKLLIKPKEVDKQFTRNGKSLQVNPQQQRPQRQRSPQKLERWKLLVDKGGNLLLQGHLVLNDDMVTGQIFTTKPVEIWKRGGVVQTRDNRIFHLIGEMFDPSGDVPVSVKKIIQEREPVDWKKLAHLMRQTKYICQNGDAENSLSVSKNSINSLPQESVTARSLWTRGKKRDSEEANPSETHDGDIQNSPSSVPAKRYKRGNFSFTCEEIIERKRVTRSVVRGVSFNLPHATGKQATVPKSGTATQKCVKNSSAMVQSSDQSSSGKDTKIVSNLKACVPSKVQTTSLEDSCPEILNEKLTVKLTPLRRSNRFSKQRSCVCCKDCDLPHLQNVKQTASKSKNVNAFLECESKQMTKINVPSLYKRCEQTSQVPDAKSSKYKIMGRPLTRSLTTRSMRSLCTSRDSSDFTSPKKSLPWLWKSASTSPLRGTRSPKQARKEGRKRLSPGKANPSKTSNSLSKKACSSRLTPNTTSSLSMKHTKSSDRNQKSEGQKSKVFVLRSQDLKTYKSEQKPKVFPERGQDLRTSYVTSSRVRKNYSPKEPSRKDDEKSNNPVQKSDKNPPRKINKKSERSFSKHVKTKYVKEEELKPANKDSNSSADCVHDSGSVRSNDSDSSCGPSASVIFNLRRIQEIKAPRTLRERQLQDEQIEQMQKKAFAAVDDDDDPLANLDLHFNGVTNEQCDYNRLLRKRRYSKSDSCCTPPTCYIMEEEEGNNEDAASSVATPSLLSWEPQRKAIQSYMQRQRTWNSGQRPKVNNGEISTAVSSMPVMTSMDYSVVRTKEKDAVSYVSSFFADEESDD